MKGMCDFCEEMVELEPTYTTSHLRIDKDTVIPIEIKYLRCPVCGDGHYLEPTAYELHRIRQMLIRGKYNLLHWVDIIEFQKLVGWTDEYLAEFVHKPMPISVRVEDDDPLSPENDKKLREEMAKVGFEPKWDKIEL